MSAQRMNERRINERRINEHGPSPLSERRAVHLMAIARHMPTRSLASLTPEPLPARTK
jgi:hypothetical protein